jgi:localization factor PodJL
MKFGFSWSVKGIRPEARQTAQEAARRAGLPLSDWLNAIILQQAVAQGVRTPSFAHDGREEEAANDLSHLHVRLDDLARRIDEMTRTGAAAYAPKRSRDESDQLTELFARLEQRFDQFAANLRPTTQPATPDTRPTDLDRAIAEITARRRSLNGEAAPPPPQHIAPVPAAPAPDLSGLEGQLRRITDQIETLRRPGVEEAIAALRAELGEISRTLNEAMPRRAIETIEKQIQELTQRIAEGREAGVDSSTLAGIEKRLAELHEALCQLMPAENLVGYTDAIEALSRKIDLIVAQRDPATMQQLERSIGTLREMAAHVASNETMSGLSAQVQAVADKIDHMAVGGGGDALNKLELRIDALSRAVTDRAQSGDTLPPRLEGLLQSLHDKIEQIVESRGGDALNKLELRIDALSRAVADRTQSGDPLLPRLEGLLQSLHDKIEQIVQSRGNQSAALGHLEDHLAKLVARLDATDNRLSHLDAIERGVADLLVHIEDIRANKETGGIRAETAPGIDVLKQDMARTHDALEAVHGSLDRVADRLAVIEKDIRSAPPMPLTAKSEVMESVQSGSGGSTDLVIRTPDPARVEPNIATQTEAVAAALRPATPAPEPARPVFAELSNLGLRPMGQPVAVDYPPPGDQPLEPGSGRPGPGTAPGARIAASEAALGVARSSVTTPAGKSSFIAAARRAAQAAGQDPKGRPVRTEPVKTSGEDNGSLRIKVMTRVKSLFLAASIVAIIIGSTQFATQVFDFGFFDTNSAKFADSAETDSATGDIADAIEPEQSKALGEGQPALSSAPPTAAANSDVTSSLLAPPNLPGLTPAAPPSAPTATPIQPPTILDPVSQTSRPALPPPQSNIPLPGAAPGAKADVTGSIARAPADSRPNRQPAPAAQPPNADGLPAAIGAPRLRTAALAGDPAAAYEVAIRFTEGRGVPANLEEAARWFERAASKGLAPAQFRYASMLEKGQGIKKDLGAAQRLYVAAASKGHAKAMHNLAVLYAEGADGKPDYVNAAQWFRKAAEHGVADSQYNLGVLTARGLGTEKNIAESYKWFALAAAQGDRDAGRKRDDVAAYLDAQAIATAQQAVKAFTAQAQPAEASVVPEPPGGWDRATPPSHEKPRAAGPLSIGASNSGKL